MTTPTPAEIAGLIAEAKARADELVLPNYHDPVCPFTLHCFCGDDGQPAPHDRVMHPLASPTERTILCLIAALTAQASEIERLRQLMTPFADIGDQLEDALDLIEDEDRRENVQIIFGGMKCADSGLADFVAARDEIYPPADPQEGGA